MSHLVIRGSRHAFSRKITREIPSFCKEIAAKQQHQKHERYATGNKSNLPVSMMCRFDKAENIR
jgi:hypothetical protein